VEGSEVTGDYLEQPTTEKAYLNENNVLTLVYVVKMAVSKPFGYWEYYVDADSGRIISKRDRAIKQSKGKRAGDAFAAPPDPGALVDREAALVFRLHQRIPKSA
jgi:zinc metalloprotease ZmpB